MSEQRNVLFIQTDEHRRDAMGCAGHPVVRTPNLDRLAERGTRFTNAYCNSPLCVPSRASLATGRYVHEIDVWDNALPYHGQAPSWGEQLTESGVDVSAIGRKHFDPYADTGFPDQRLPDLSEPPIEIKRLEKDPVEAYEHAEGRFGDPGINENRMEMSDERTDEAIEWLQEEAPSDRPWVLNLSYQPPHFPLSAPSKYREMYPLDEVDLPIDYPGADDHPVIEDLRRHFKGTDLDEETIRSMRAGYYALCTAIDERIGRVLDALEESEHAEETVVVYTSDHGELVGDHGLWWKCCTYESSAGIPLIVSGPGVPEGETRETPVSLVDVPPTLADYTGADPDPGWSGESIRPLVEDAAAENHPRLDEDGPDAPGRSVLCEYHGHGVSRGMFMIRLGEYKYVYYPDHGPQLFNLAENPEETDNLAGSPAHEAIRERLHQELLDTVEGHPDEIDRRARENQRRRVRDFERLPEKYQ